MAVDVDEGGGIVLGDDVVVPDLVVQRAGTIGSKQSGGNAGGGGGRFRRGKGVDTARSEGQKKSGEAKSGHIVKDQYSINVTPKAEQDRAKARAAKQRIRSDIFLPLAKTGCVRRACLALLVEINCAQAEARRRGEEHLRLWRNPKGVDKRTDVHLKMKMGSGENRIAGDSSRKK